MAAIPPTPPEAAEPLAESAPLAWRLAPQLCRVEPRTGESCAWYHGLWQYLRLLGLGTSPSLHADFLSAAIGAAAPRGASLRVLIAGAADYSMLSCVLAACRAHGLRAEPTVIDWCETPLMLSRWYAKRAGVEVATLKRNLLDIGGASAHDLVCTHALLGHFAPPERAALLAQWHAALRPGGRVVTLNRLRPGGGDEPARFTALEVDTFSDKVRQGFRAITHPPEIGENEVASAAARYAERQISWPVRDADEVRELFEGAGFAIEHLSVARLAAPAAGRGLDVPTVPTGAEYARIIAVRR